MVESVDISMTEAACAQMRKSLAEVGKKAVHITLREAGCSGLEYVLDYADAPLDSDLACEFEGFSLYVDAESYNKALRGLKIDYHQDLLSSGFIYQNPNKKGECGCGVSFTV